MEIRFNESTKDGLKSILEGSSENYLRIKVFRGCGKAAYEIHPSYYDAETDKLIEVERIPFVFYKEDEKAIDGIEIIYDKEKYIGGFYIK